MSILHKILVATDGSEVSITAARMAVVLAAQHRAELRMAHVVDDEAVKELSRAVQRRKRGAANHV